MTGCRIGHGYDVHRLVEGRPLVLGGVVIPYSRGLDGHSDADCLLHAIMDAVLGAAALGDIGKHFPDSQEAYRGADSFLLACEVFRLVVAHGYAVCNIDATLIAEKPKISPFVEAMRSRIAEAFHCPLDAVNVKATTEEGLGFSGRGEGIAAHAVCLLQKQ